MSQQSRAAGPLGSVVSRVGEQVNIASRPAGAGANPLVLLNRTAFLAGPARAGGPPARAGLDKDALRKLLRWAEEHDLGQESWLVQAAQQRRQRALARAATGQLGHRRVRATPQWRLAVGLGNRLNAHEIGLSLHGTYGMPVIMGSTVKGMTRAWALAHQQDQHRADQFRRIFGKDGTGSVWFLDALPSGRLTIARDVVTPHVQPYYQGTAAPGEYHNPVPSEFLVVAGGEFGFDLLGPSEDLDLAVTWCRAAIDELGVGGKTGAGYGYLTPEEDPA